VDGVLRTRLRRFVRTRLTCSTVIAIALLSWLGAASTSAQAPPSDDLRIPHLDEVRIGALAHSIEPSNSEDGLDLNLELLFRRTATKYNDPFLDFAFRPRIHLGTSINLGGDTSQLYAGLTWDVKLAPELSLEVSFGGALHDGPTGNDTQVSYGCPLNFRESISVGYAIDERWTVYGTFAHMSNADLCDQNTGISSVGLRLGYKLR
jgi:hypothetical protein